MNANSQIPSQMFAASRTFTGKCLLLVATLGILVTSLRSATAQRPPDDLDQVRKEFLMLAPYLSMDGKLTMEIVDANSVARAMKRIHEYSQLSFTSREVLAKVGPAHMEFLAKCQLRVVPAFRAEKFETEALMLEAFSRLMEQHVLRAWQVETDKRCAEAYAQVLTVAREIAAERSPTARGPKSVSAKCGDRSLALTQHMGRDLTNVTLVVRFHSITKETYDAYYFLPEWGSESLVSLRVPDSWADAKGPTTVKVTIEVISDERSTWPLSIDFPENVANALDLALKQVKNLSSADPVRAMALLSGLSGAWPADWREEIGSLRTSIRARANAIQKRVKQKINLQKLSNARIRRTLDKNRITGFQRDRYQQQLETGEARLEELDQYARDLHKIK